MFTTFKVLFFIFTTTKETFSKISFSLSGKDSYALVIYIYIINQHLNKKIKSNQKIKKLKN